MSESDFPFEVFEWAGTNQISHPDEEDLLFLGGYEGTEDVETRTVEEMFRGANANPPLLAIIGERLRGAQGFRVGEVVIDCWVVGRAKSGNLAGLKTRSVET